MLYLFEKVLLSGQKYGNPENKEHLYLRTSLLKNHCNPTPHKPL